MKIENKPSFLNTLYLTKESLKLSALNKDFKSVEDKNSFVGNLLVEGQKLFLVMVSDLSIVSVTFSGYGYGYFKFKTDKDLDISISKSDMDVMASLFSDRLVKDGAFDLFFSELSANNAVQSELKSRINALKHDERELKGIYEDNPLDVFGIHMEASGMRYMRPDVFRCIIGSKLEKSVLTEIDNSSKLPYKISVMSGNETLEIITVKSPEQAISVIKELYIQITNELGVESVFNKEVSVKSVFKKNSRTLYPGYSMSKELDKDMKF